jgi:DNA polymerase-3 subunit beta
LSFFSKLINFLPNKIINLETENLVLKIEGENFYTKIKGVSGEDFPIIPQYSNQEWTSFNCLKFCQALSQIYDIPSPSVARPEISGIFLNFQPNLVKLVATDSFRLFERTIFQKTNLPKEYSLILPQKAAKEIINIFGEKKEELKFYFSPNQIWLESMIEEVSHPEIQFTSRLIEGEYPNYQEIIPKKFETTFVVLKEEFLEKLKIANLFSGKTNEVNLKIIPQEKKIEINSQSPDFGEYKSFLKGEIKGKENQISFNCRFLFKGVSEIKSKELLFEISNKEGPAIIKPNESLINEDYLYIVMPIKTP